VNSCFNGLGEALNRLLQPRLAELDHLCSCSEDVAARLAGVQTHARSILLKLDIKDFYLAGEHGFIVQHVSESFEVKAEREFVASALQLILGMQFVSNSFDPDSRRHTIYKVEQGSGIGMKHAGAVSDWLFWRAVERIVLKEPDLGVSCYLRFQDDLLFCLTTSDTPPSLGLESQQQPPLIVR
jgi:hypothetical protein